MVWIWFGFGLKMVWIWFEYGLDIVWIWFEFGYNFTHIDRNHWFKEIHKKRKKQEKL